MITICFYNNNTPMVFSFKLSLPRMDGFIVSIGNFRVKTTKKG